MSSPLPLLRPAFAAAPTDAPEPRPSRALCIAPQVLLNDKKTAAGAVNIETNKERMKVRLRAAHGGRATSAHSVDAPRQRTPCTAADRPTAARHRTVHPKPHDSPRRCALARCRFPMPSSRRLLCALLRHPAGDARVLAARQGGRVEGGAGQAGHVDRLPRQRRQNQAEGVWPRAARHGRLGAARSLQGTGRAEVLLARPWARGAACAVLCFAPAACGTRCVVVSSPCAALCAARHTRPRFRRGRRLLHGSGPFTRGAQQGALAPPGNKSPGWPPIRGQLGCPSWHILHLPMPLLPRCPRCLSASHRSSSAPRMYSSASPSLAPLPPISAFTLAGPHLRQVHAGPRRRPPRLHGSNHKGRLHKRVAAGGAEAHGCATGGAGWQGAGGLTG